MGDQQASNFDPRGVDVTRYTYYDDKNGLGMNLVLNLLSFSTGGWTGGFGLFILFNLCPGYFGICTSGR